MKRRNVILVPLLAVILVVGSVAIARSLLDGNFQRLGAEAKADVTAFKNLADNAAGLRKLPGVKTVDFSYNALHLPDPTAKMSVVMKPHSRTTDVVAAANFVTTASVRAKVPAGTLTLTVDAPKLSVTETTFQVGDTTLADQLRVWDALDIASLPPLRASVDTSKQATGTPLSTLTVKPMSESATNVAAVVKSYPSTLAELANDPVGPAWNLPGMSGQGNLPTSSVLKLLAASSTAVPISIHSESHTTSGVWLDWYGSNFGIGNMFLEYFEKDGRTALDPAEHLQAASNLAHIVAAANLTHLNFDYAGVHQAKLVDYRFFAYTCDGHVNALDENRDTLATLSLTSSNLNGGSAGVCAANS